MELLWSQLKIDNMKGFLTEIQFYKCLIILFGFFNLSLCLYEDQIGKFDWKQSYIGKLKFSQFDILSTSKRVIIATEENVLAALNLKAGQLIWRQVLEQDEKGDIQFLHLETEVVCVTGSKAGPWIVRGWEPATGSLLWEWSLALSNPVNDYPVYWFTSHGRLMQILSVPGSHIEVTGYNLKTGLNRGSTTKITANWAGDSPKCVLALPYFTCISNISGEMKLYAVNVLSESNVVNSLPLHSLYSSTVDIYISPIDSPEPMLALTQGQVKKIVSIKSNGMHISSETYNADSSIAVIPIGDSNVVLTVLSDEKVLQVSANSLETGMVIPELTGEMEIPNTLGAAQLSSAICSSRRDKNTSCRLLISTEDHAIVLLQNPAKILWVREEALANILAVDMLDLPVSEHDASIETEFDSENGDIIGTLMKRLTSQINQLHSSLMAILGVGSSSLTSGDSSLVRDEFGLHKIVVAITSAGKIFGIDTANGNIIWQRRLKNVTPYNCGNKNCMNLFVQRTTRHFPHNAQCAILAKDKTTGEGVLFMFNPITGEPVDEGLKKLGYRVKQTMLLPEGNSAFLRGLVLLDTHGAVHVVPESTKPVLLKLAPRIYMFTVDRETGVLTGYSLAESTTERFTATQAWQLKLTSRGQRITHVVSKNPLERVHSQGRVLADRSVLFKYSNPNLVAIATQASDPIHKHVLSIYLVDVVSGIVVFSIVHKRARSPIHLVHSENWMVYSYFNDKWRRTEIGTLELYDGKEQSNSTSFSSHVSTRLPLVERQAYIMPSTILAIKETITEKGITNKHILMALANGGILEMPWIFLDPRRPISAPPEEGVVPYMPELPIPSEAFLNYNQSIFQPHGIHTVPSGLESTCLVFVHGLDIFYTRVAPSKTFDVLKEDFDHYLITIVLGVLLLASYVTRQLASRKALKQAWK